MTVSFSPRNARTPPWDGRVVRSIGAGGGGDAITTDFKEFGVILEGQGDLVYGTETYHLNTCDSVSFSSDIPHTLKNTGEVILKAIWIITPPRLLFARK